MIRRFLIIAAALILLCGTAFAAETAEFIYGESQQGRPLRCVRIGDENAEKRMLLLFGIHGFEDSFDRDGAVLSEIAQLMIDHYTAAELPGSTALYIVPCANPDGLLAGTSRDGFGRCSANGVDINRDFPVRWSRKTKPRNLTGDAPFSTPEACAIRDLTEQVMPQAACDIHGWINCIFGTRKLSKVFASALDCRIKTYSGGGMCGQWFASVCPEAVTVELPAGPGRAGYASSVSEKLISAVDRWLRD